MTRDTWKMRALEALAVLAVRLMVVMALVVVLAVVVSTPLAAWAMGAAIVVVFLLAVVALAKWRRRGGHALNPPGNPEAEG